MSKIDEPLAGSDNGGYDGEPDNSGKPGSGDSSVWLKPDKHVPNVPTKKNVNEDRHSQPHSGGDNFVWLTPSSHTYSTKPSDGTSNGGYERDSHGDVWLAPTSYTRTIKTEVKPGRPDTHHSVWLTPDKSTQGSDHSVWLTPSSHDNSVWLTPDHTDTNDRPGNQKTPTNFVWLSPHKHDPSDSHDHDHPSNAHQIHVHKNFHGSPDEVRIYANEGLDSDLDDLSCPGDGDDIANHKDVDDYNIPEHVKDKFRNLDDIMRHPK